MPEKKFHILIMDDSIAPFMAGFGIDTNNILQKSGVNVEIHIAPDRDSTKEILTRWAEQGIAPDLVSVDFLFGQFVGPAEYARIQGKVYKNRENLKPKKLGAVVD